MKIFGFGFLVGSALAGDEVPGQNGWKSGCRIPLRNAAFATYDAGDVWVTAFQVAGDDHIYRIKNFDGSADGCSGNEVETIFEGTFPWPNSVQRVPDSIFNDGNKWYSISAGFFPDNKNDGCIAFFNGDNSNPSDTTIFMTPGCGNSPQEDPFFYHKIEWLDMDNDGDLDFVTARVINDGPVTPLDEDLLWFENDGIPSNSNNWKMHRFAGMTH